MHFTVRETLLCTRLACLPVFGKHRCWAWGKAEGNLIHASSNPLTVWVQPGGQGGGRGHPQTLWEQRMDWGVQGGQRLGQRRAGARAGVNLEGRCGFSHCLSSDTSLPQRVSSTELSPYLTLGEGHGGEPTQLRPCYQWFLPRESMRNHILKARRRGEPVQLRCSNRKGH